MGFIKKTRLQKYLYSKGGPCIRPTSVNNPVAQKKPISNQLSGFYVYKRWGVRVNSPPHSAVERPILCLVHPSLHPLSHASRASPPLFSHPLSCASLSLSITKAAWPYGSRSGAARPIWIEELAARWRGLAGHVAWPKLQHGHGPSPGDAPGRLLACVATW